VGQDNDEKKNDNGKMMSPTHGTSKRHLYNAEPKNAPVKLYELSLTVTEYTPLRHLNQDFSTGVILV